MMLSTLLILTAIMAEPEVRKTEYVRPSGDGFVLESVIDEKETKDGSTYRSVTHRPGTTLELRIDFDKKGEIVSGHIRLRAKEKEHKAEAIVEKKTIRVRREGKEVQSLPLDSPPVVMTSAPDWSDILLLIRRYDRKKGGKQEMRGIWFHPIKEAHLRTFTVEKVGSRKLKKIELGEYRVMLRSGAYVVRADEEGRVYLIRKPGGKKPLVVLKGYESILRGW